MSENNNENYKIILEYIKDLSIETPNVQALTFVRQNLSNYIMDIDISTVALKNNALEVTTKLTLQDKKDSLEKSFFEIKYATVIGIDTNINDKKIIGKIVLCDLQKEIYPKIKEIFLGYYFKWDPNQHVKLVKEKYDWIESKKPFQRTYRRASNLDDKYENGAHDLLKFIKFGYGRTTDHTSKDILTGYMGRDKGVRLVKKLDQIINQYDKLLDDEQEYEQDIVLLSELEEILTQVPDFSNANKSKGKLLDKYQNPKEYEEIIELIQFMTSPEKKSVFPLLSKEISL